MAGGGCPGPGQLFPEYFRVPDREQTNKPIHHARILSNKDAFFLLGNPFNDDTGSFFRGGARHATEIFHMELRIPGHGPGETAIAHNTRINATRMYAVGFNMSADELHPEGFRKTPYGKFRRAVCTLV